MAFERYKANAYIFDKQDDGKELFVIKYPTKQKQGWYFWIVIESGTYELDLPKAKRWESERLKSEQSLGRYNRLG